MGGSGSAVRSPPAVGGGRGGGISGFQVSGDRAPMAASLGGEGQGAAVGSTEVMVRPAEEGEAAWEHRQPGRAGWQVAGVTTSFGLGRTVVDSGRAAR